jgi:hypothetical protein
MASAAVPWPSLVPNVSFYRRIRIRLFQDKRSCRPHEQISFFSAMVKSLRSLLSTERNDLTIAEKNEI